jgi:magnesium-transporting ATPase (P-type)
MLMSGMVLPSDGLSAADAAERLARFGPNALPEQPPAPLWRRFLRQFNSPLIFILLFALAFDAGLWMRDRWIHVVAAGESWTSIGARVGVDRGVLAARNVVGGLDAVDGNRRRSVMSCAEN